MKTLHALLGPAIFNTDPGTGWTTKNLNDADNSGALVFAVPKDGTITKVGVYCGGITGNPPAYNVGIVTVDGATGIPTSTAYGGSSIDTYDFTAAGWVWVTLGTPATAVAGDIAAVRVWPTGTAPDGSNFATWRSSSGIITSGGIPRGMDYTSLWAATTGVSVMAVEYDDGQVVGFPITSILASAAYGPATTPDEVGAVFQVPVDVDCVGCLIFLQLVPANGAYTVKLYDSDGSTVLRSVVVADEDLITGLAAHTEFRWDPIRLNAGLNYRLTVLAVSGSANYQQYMPTIESSNSRNAFPEGANWQETERTDGGAWSQTATLLPWMAIIIDGVFQPTMAAAAA